MACVSYGDSSAPLVAINLLAYLSGEFTDHAVPCAVRLLGAVFPVSYKLQLVVERDAVS